MFKDTIRLNGQYVCDLTGNVLGELLYVDDRAAAYLCDDGTFRRKRDQAKIRTGAAILASRSLPGRPNADHL